MGGREGRADMIDFGRSWLCCEGGVEIEDEDG